MKIAVLILALAASAAAQTATTPYGATEPVVVATREGCIYAMKVEELTFKIPGKEGTSLWAKAQADRKVACMPPETLPTPMIPPPTPVVMATVTASAIPAISPAEPAVQIVPVTQVKKKKGMKISYCFGICFSGSTHDDHEEK